MEILTYVSGGATTAAIAPRPAGGEREEENKTTT